MTLTSIRTYKEKLMADINLRLQISYNNTTYTTHLVEWINSTIIFEAPLQGIDDVILPINISLSANFISKLALFHTHFKIIKRHKLNNILYYTAEITSPLIKKQRRSAFRLDTLLDISYDVLETTDHNKIIHSCKGTCLNLSLGGMCLGSHEQLHTDTHINLYFSLLDVPLVFKGRVLSLGELTEQGNYKHHIRFVDLESSNIERLNRLIFEKQRLQLKHS